MLDTSQNLIIIDGRIRTARIEWCRYEVPDKYCIGFAGNPKIDSAPAESPSFGIAGGEDTLLGDRLFGMIRHIKSKLPDTGIHSLTSGRAFADKTHARRLAASRSCRTLRQSAVRRVHIAHGIGIRGLYDKEQKLRRVDPLDYRAESMRTVMERHDWRMAVSIFDQPRCMLPESLRPFARKSISDWKTKYLDSCRNCTERTECCGLSATSKVQSRDIKPIDKQDDVRNSVLIHHCTAGSAPDFAVPRNRNDPACDRHTGSQASICIGTPTKRPFEKGLSSGKRDSDPRPQPWQGCALPTELFPQSAVCTS